MKNTTPFRFGIECLLVQCLFIDQPKNYSADIFAAFGRGHGGKYELNS